MNVLPVKKKKILYSVLWSKVSSLIKKKKKEKSFSLVCKEYLHFATVQVKFSALMTTLGPTRWSRSGGRARCGWQCRAARLRAGASLGRKTARSSEAVFEPGIPGHPAGARVAGVRARPNRSGDPKLRVTAAAKQPGERGQLTAPGEPPAARREALPRAVCSPVRSSLLHGFKEKKKKKRKL